MHMRAGFDADGRPSNVLCSFCGGMDKVPPTAMWHTAMGDDLFICRDCAITSLAHFAADAIAGAAMGCTDGRGQQARMLQGLKTHDREMWRALALAFSRAGLAAPR